MRFLVDECLTRLTAQTMDVLGEDHDFIHLREVEDRDRIQDEEIPGIGKTYGFDCLISLNFKDFAAKKKIIQAVLDAGMHAIVVRGQRKGRKGTYWQVSVLAIRFESYLKMLCAAVEPTLLVVKEGSVRKLTLDELIEEIEAGESGRGRLP